MPYRGGYRIYQHCAQRRQGANNFPFASWRLLCCALPTLRMTSLRARMSSLRVRFVSLREKIDVDKLPLAMRSVLPLIVLFFSAGQLPAQVLVHEEPRHRPVFQNDKIRILDVLVPPGDTTQYHIHHTPSLFLYFTTTTTFSQLRNGPTLRGRGISGRFIFENLAAPNERVHRVWNVDTGSLHVMDIELLSKITGFEQDALSLKQFRLEIDTPWVRVYRLTLEAGNDFAIPGSRHSLLLVNMDSATAEFLQNGRSQLRVLQPGSFFEIRPRESFALKNTGRNTAHFALLELPGQ